MVLDTFKQALDKVKGVQVKSYGQLCSIARAPATVVNPLAGAVCNIAKAAGGGAIDFNKLCK